MCLRDIGSWQSLRQLAGGKIMNSLTYSNNFPLVVAYSASLFYGTKINNHVFVLLYPAFALE